MSPRVSLEPIAAISRGKRGQRQKALNTANQPRFVAALRAREAARKTAGAILDNRQLRSIQLQKVPLGLPFENKCLHDKHHNVQTPNSVLW